MLMPWARLGTLDLEDGQANRVQEARLDRLGDLEHREFPVILDHLAPSQTSNRSLSKSNSPREARRDLLPIHSPTCRHKLDQLDRVDHQVKLDNKVADMLCSFPVLSLTIGMQGPPGPQGFQGAMVS